MKKKVMLLESLPEYFTIEYSKDYHVKDNPQAEEWLPAHVMEALEEVQGLRFDDETSMEECYTEIDTYWEDGVDFIYSIRLGAFVEWEDKFTLEDEFDSMKEIYNDLKDFTFDEMVDFIYRPYILIELKRPDRRYR